MTAGQEAGNQDNWSESWSTLILASTLTLYRIENKSTASTIRDHPSQDQTNRFSSPHQCMPYSLCDTDVDAMQVMISLWSGKSNK